MARLTIDRLYAIKRGGAAPTARPRPKPEKEASMPKSLPSPELLRKLLRYEPDTGKLFWRERPRELFKSDGSFKRWKSKFAGKEAFSGFDDGYKRGYIFGVKFWAHRVCYAIFFGKWPSGQIDHINGIKSDNRIINIRDVSCSENLKNKRLQRNNTSGVCGVYFYKPTEKWGASIKLNKRSKHLGYFHKIEDAIAARKAAEVKYGFHENHGRD